MKSGLRDGIKSMNFLKYYRNKIFYRHHTKSVYEFLRETFPTLKLKAVMGPLESDNKQNELFYLVTFDKDCPENQIHLKIDKSTMEVSEAERY